MKRIILIIVLVVVVGAIGWYLWTVMNPNHLPPAFPN